MSDIFQIPATISKVQSMSNRALRLQVDTQEGLTDSQMARTMQQLDKYGHFCHLEDRQVDASDLLELEDLPKQQGVKSQATRLRNAIYVWGEQKGLKTREEHDDFYHSTMEKIISQVKEKLV